MTFLFFWYYLFLVGFSSKIKAIKTYFYYKCQVPLKLGGVIPSSKALKVTTDYFKCVQMSNVDE